jgi:hypothetical protein
MSFAIVHSRALDGLGGAPVTVEVHLANGLPSFTLVGLADTEVKESRERVRAALAQSGFAFPHNRRITVNLAPADLPKESARFDLPIALGILAASGVIDPARLEGFEFAGELSLRGALRPVRGALARALAARHGAPLRTLVLPAGSAELAARVQGLDVRSAVDLLQVVRSLVPGPEGAEARAAAARVAFVDGGRARATGPARREGPGRRQACTRDRRRGWAQPLADRAAGNGQVDARAAAARDPAADDRRRGPRQRRDPGPHARGLRPRGIRPTAGARAAPLGERGRPGRRRLAAASGRNLARARRHSLS